jgi:hypothetical protein
MTVRDLMGLYRIRGAQGAELLYVGQGAISARLARHARISDRPDLSQGAIFSSSQKLQVSWTAGDWLTHQRLELETDLIAAHMIATCRVPEAQFRG